MARVSFENVVKKFGDVVAVNNLNIDVADKEFLVLVGPSGCGKTTALRCLAGLEEITDGSIKIGERVVNDIAPKDRDIAMVFHTDQSGRVPVTRCPVIDRCHLCTSHG